MRVGPTKRDPVPAWPIIIKAGLLNSISTRKRREGRMSNLESMKREVKGKDGEEERRRQEMEQPEENGEPTSGVVERSRSDPRTNQTYYSEGGNLDNEVNEMYGHAESETKGRTPGRSSRKRTRQGRYISDITLDEVLQHVDLPAHEACKKIGLGTNMCQVQGFVCKKNAADSRDDIA